MKINSNKNIVYLFMLIIIFILSFFKIRENLITKISDDGDAPSSYGAAIHYKPDEGPYFGKKSGNSHKPVPDSISLADNINPNQNRDDAFPFIGNAADVVLYNKPLLAPDINAEENLYSINVQVSKAMQGDPVRGWIDFNGNGAFEKYEKASAAYVTGSSVILSWRLPLDLKNVLTIMRLRTCSKLYQSSIELPVGKAITGEVEDYAVRISRNNNPTTEVKEKLDFTPYTEIENETIIKEVLNNMAFGNTKFAITLSGTKPDIFGINDKHGASVTGLRVGHFEKTVITHKNPILIHFKSSISIQNFNFQIIDIDGGDRIKIEGYNNGKPVEFDISNLSDNYYAQYNSVTKEVYGDKYADAGGEEFIESSLDMGVNVVFADFIDSVKLTYSDDSPQSSGTFTLSNFSVRKYQFKEVTVKDFFVKDNIESLLLSFKTLYNENLAQYNIERSIDGKTYETIYTSKDTKSDLYTFIDNTLSPAFQVCFYRIKIIEKDNYSKYSNVFRLRRNLSESLLGFKPKTFNFINSDTITLNVLKDMPGNIQLNMYNYAAKKIKTCYYKDKKKSDSILLTQVLKLPAGIYYIEILNNKNKFLVEVSNN